MDNEVYLRALEIDDYKTTIKWRKDDEIWKSVTGPKYFVSSEYEKNWVIKAINNPNEVRVGICLKENDLLIGLASMIYIDMVNRSGAFSVMIGNKKYWSGGFATEAIKLLLAYCFNERGMERIWGPILESNIASQKVAFKCGFKKEGVLRNSVFKNGEYHNQIMVSILREEYLNLTKNK